MLISKYMVAIRYKLRTITTTIDINTFKRPNATLIANKSSGLPANTIMDKNESGDLPVEAGDVVSIEVMIRTVRKRGAESLVTSERKLQRLGFTVPSSGVLSIPTPNPLGLPTVRAPAADADASDDSQEPLTVGTLTASSTADDIKPGDVVLAVFMATAEICSDDSSDADLEPSAANVYLFTVQSVADGEVTGWWFVSKDDVRNNPAMGARLRRTCCKGVPFRPGPSDDYAVIPVEDVLRPVRWLSDERFEYSLQEGEVEVFPKHSDSRHVHIMEECDLMPRVSWKAFARVLAAQRKHAAGEPTGLPADAEARLIATSPFKSMAELVAV